MKIFKNTLQILTVSISFLVIVGCNPNLNTNKLRTQLTEQNQNIDELPTLFENPDAEAEVTPQMDVETESTPTTTNNTTTSVAESPLAKPPPPTVSNQPVVTPPPVVATQPPIKPEPSVTEKPPVSETQPVITQPSRPVEQKPVTTTASRFIQYAHEVMIKEGKAIGTPCNYYVQRVLVRAGFPKGDFRANEFALYAKKNFKFYKAEDFKIDTSRSDKDDLKKHLWSYPERTPFILQWTRPGHYGHIAILERIGDSLIIYQASIGSHTAQRSQTKIETLLSSKHRAHLTVYSEFK